MEKNCPTATAITVAINACPIPNKDRSPRNGSGHKKKRGPMSLIKATLSMMRRQSSSKKPLPVEEAAGGATTWKKVVGSMRPLHLQDNNDGSNRSSNINNNNNDNNSVSESPRVIDYFEDVFPPPSPACSEGASSSRYASAQNLQELDRSEEEEREEEEVEGSDGIDTKADEFIAQFYKEMGLQRLGSVQRYNRMVARNSA